MIQAIRWRVFDSLFVFRLGNGVLQGRGQEGEYQAMSSPFPLDLNNFRLLRHTQCARAICHVVLLTTQACVMMGCTICVHAPSVLIYQSKCILMLVCNIFCACCVVCLAAGLCLQSIRTAYELHLFLFFISSFPSPVL